MNTTEADKVHIGEEKGVMKREVVSTEQVIRGGGEESVYLSCSI